MTGLFDRANRRAILRNSLWVVLSSTCLLPVWGQAGSHDGRDGQDSKISRPALISSDDSLQLSFSRCVSQAQQGLSKKAIACFEQWVKEHPDWPEGYNNIGVLYASIGMHAQARQWFERGLTQRQAYATLHRNLLNLQSEVNRNAYAAALQLDISKSNVQPKLSLLAKVMPPLSESAPEVVSLPSTHVTRQPGTSVVPEPVVAKEKATQKSAATPAPSLPTSVDSAVDLAQKTNIEKSVQAWAQAWSKKDLNAYFKAYASTFNPGSNLSRSVWEEQRRDRIMSKKQIDIELSEFSISLSNSKATAKFRQSYRSGSMVTISRKTLELAEDNGQWVITREFVSGSGS
ncbi:MAG: L,D-transpeptidase Cds6 family protein [Limnohabitans sp.]